ncbi:translation elongation factor Ts [Candidatus Roizmanbacteria bacterium RIFCSPHIGHO2_01_FULL_39_12b]|uniref:Elongation factor Ts n=1 Tax=Candidatus Roizmanbacteria bacterium RIFCSPHIGHO2_01_FULL_39_12b TaxID=1802030 RepID=A0A1F7G7Z0_9BACT|nr:MAG: translation elongation factor Ts [Candidatus Roizmanbacteria bacterium RIFCSPHIGHO2_01_FULL_39_12b]
MSQTELLKKLREETGLSYSECFKALTQAKGDLTQAKGLLKEWGVNFAEKKSEREAHEGRVFTYVHHNRKIGSMVEVMCETDFVAKNEEFMTLGADIAMQIASTAPQSRDELMKSEFIKDTSTTIENHIKQFIFKLGENITIGRFERFAL